ncbi:tetratricopeptide repeat protein [Sulfurovum sp.]|uniref:tetratricopeptide repeat protein n=1 Tax=Sulfurovum sp. TaxID=1969726 RepID=UPI00356657B2
MNQTKKRLSIINHAISITDVETIQLQILKLVQLKSDVKIQEIVTAIQAENYAQAQGLINRYIETPTENILQRTSQKAQATMAEEDQAIIDEFDLFITSNTVEKPQEIDINDFLLDELPVRKKVETKKVDHSDFDALLNIDIDNVLTDNIEMGVAHTSKDTFFDSPKEINKQAIDTSHIPKDTFFDTIETLKEEPVTQETPKKEEVIIEKSEPFIQMERISKEDPLKELKPAIKTEEEARSINYKAIPYIAQKLLSMKKQYPPIEGTYEKFDSVENLLRKISQEGYSEADIEETLTYIKQLTEDKKDIEASQLLLVCAATESKFAQFMLARELYKGTLITKDVPEAFTQMHSLALEDYPEALSDLAQFYEYGIGTGKDQKKAEQFYKEAMDFGIKRAEKHYKRLKKQNRGFFKR